MFLFKKKKSKGVTAHLCSQKQLSSLLDIQGCPLKLCPVVSNFSVSVSLLIPSCFRWMLFICFYYCQSLPSYQHQWNHLPTALFRLERCSKMYHLCIITFVSLITAHPECHVCEQPLVYTAILTADVVCVE